MKCNNQTTRQNINSAPVRLYYEQNAASLRPEQTAPPRLKKMKKGFPKNNNVLRDLRQRSNEGCIATAN